MMSTHSFRFASELAGPSYAWEHACAACAACQGAATSWPCCEPKWQTTKLELGLLLPTDDAKRIRVKALIKEALHTAAAQKNWIRVLQLHKWMSIPLTLSLRCEVRLGFPRLRLSTL